MRYGLAFLIAILYLLGSFPQSGQSKDLLFLKDNWVIQTTAHTHSGGEQVSSPRFQTTGWYPAKVPGTVLAILVDNGVYSDPYYAINLKTVLGYRDGSWLVMPPGSPFKNPWWYRTEFLIPDRYQGKHVALHLDGINYKANIWLNERKVAGAESVVGMFRSFEFDITEYVLPGKPNHLAVEIIPPGQLSDVPYATKQIQATTGWDDHNPQPPDMNMGLWKDVYITATGPVALSHPYVVTDLDLPSLDEAHLTISAEARNLTGRAVEGELKGNIGRLGFSKQVRLEANEIKLLQFTPEEFKQLNIRKPRLWWPNPVGPQDLYELELAIAFDGEVSDAEHVRFGIREVSTYINDEGWRGYKINGKNILVRGGAWMTSDMLLRLDPTRYEALIRYAKNANLNMLRSEGFSIRETDEFYDLCDRYGIMVTQQIFGRSIPEEDLAVRLIEDTILRIRNHPSLVHFLGHDETFPTPTLDRAYRELIARYTPERTYQPHSGAFDVRERFETGGTRTGTRELWTYANASHYYTHKEDGAWGFAQSGGIGGIVSPIESLRKMMPEKDLWPPTSEAFSFHTVTQGIRYFDAFREALDRRYGPATDIVDFALKAQAMNYESARGMFEAYGRNKYSATGITTWKYNAAWPAALTWQYIDWNLYAGGAYYGAQKACEPLHVQYAYDDQAVYVVNSYYRDMQNLRVTARIFDFHMVERLSEVAVVDVAADDKTKAFVIKRPEGLTGTYFLSLDLANASGKTVSDNLYWLSTIPEIEGTKGYTEDRIFYVRPRSHPDHTDLTTLPKVKIHSSHAFRKGGDEQVGFVTVENPTNHLAFLIQLAVTKGEGGEEVRPSYWSNNYFCVLPGGRKEVEVTFREQDLEGKRAALRVTGWTVE